MSPKICTNVPKVHTEFTEINSPNPPSQHIHDPELKLSLTPTITKFASHKFNGPKIRRPQKKYRAPTPQHVNLISQVFTHGYEYYLWVKDGRREDTQTSLTHHRHTSWFVGLCRQAGTLQCGRSPHTFVHDVHRPQKKYKAPSPPDICISYHEFFNNGEIPSRSDQQ